ncbi:MAG: HK97 family phage prohead protease [Parasphingorhabdus sp.]|nr:HK97 family phage prohead protease [Parasphingorhabdus sp.]|tara:strand:+ start:4338 stop:5048 length:711 start_codon:yes stop_codon:yes gene_type:complete
MMQTKQMMIENMDESGTGLARIAILAEIDSDGDTYQAGAFNGPDGEGQWVPILSAHNRGGMPYGKARVYDDGEAAYAELNLNLETQAGREWHAALKFDLDRGRPVQEWSYGYDAQEFEYRFSGKQQVRLLKRLLVDEVSTVVRGAGVGTSTIAIKSAALKEDHFAGLIASLSELESALEKDLSALSATGVKQLSEIHRAIGDALAPIVAAEKDLELSTDTAVAEYLRRQSKRHLDC